MPRTIINKANYSEELPEETRGEINTKPSETVPNEAQTIQDILDRYKVGQRPDEKPFVYIDAEDMETIDRFHRPPGSLDFTDLEELQVQNQQRMAELQRLQNSIEQEKQDIIQNNPGVDKNKDGQIDDDQTETIKD